MTDSRPPVFQFYPRDWMFDTRGFSLEARGLYLDLLSISWINDGIPDDVSELIPHLAITKAKLKKVWPEIQDKFPGAEDGKRRNPRQERERAALEQRREQQRRAGKASAEARAAK